jgi:hypothetical protein
MVMKCTVCNMGGIDWRTWKCSNPNCPLPRTKVTPLPSTCGSIREVAKEYRGTKNWWEFWK